MIHRERRVDHAERNIPYNKAAKTAVDAILQSETEVPDYIPSGAFDPHLPSTAADEPFFSVVTGEYERPKHRGVVLDDSDLGVYERVILSALAWSPYTVHCLVGEMGSGKTAVSKYIVKVLKRKKHKLCEHCETRKVCEPVVIRLDFNEGFTSEAETALKNTFRRRLYEQLRTELRAQFKTHLKVDDFVLFSQKPDVRAHFAVFDEFFERTDDDSWAKLPNYKRANELFSYIARTSDMEHKLEMLMRLLRYIVLSVRREPACGVLIFDNLDRLSSESQMTLLLEIFALQRHARFGILIPLRRTTFEKLASQRAYSFGVINHNGPDPLLIASSRIRHYLAGFDAEPLTTNVDARYAPALRARLEHVAQLLEATAPNRIVELIRGLSGESVRLGLHVIQRMFINNVISWDAGPRNPDELAWALLTGPNAHLRLDINDQLVANVFTNGQSNKPSLLVIRILGILHEFEKNPAKRTIGNLLTIGRAVGGWSQRDIIEAVNYLLRDHRPLVWVDGRSKFVVAKDATNPSSREILFLTSAGRRYFQHLIMSLNYFQDAVLGLDWDSAGVPLSVHMDDLDSRFRTLRACLRQLQEMDRREVQAFLAAGAAPDTLTPTVITNRMLYGLAKSAFLIFESQRTRGVFSTEFAEWHSVLVGGFNMEHELLQRQNSRLAHWIGEYERQLDAYRRNSRPRAGSPTSR
jgi:hypothetical protein